MSLFNINENDQLFYHDFIRDFIPNTIIDDHAHVYLKSFRISSDQPRNASWPDKIAEDCSIEELNETYRLLFPGKKVIPVIFGQPQASFDIRRCNKYVRQAGETYRYPTLLLTHPDWTAENLEKQVVDGGFKGSKVYLNYAPAYIPDSEIRIFDFLPHHQLEVLNKHGWVVMLHIPRPGRLADAVNIAQVKETIRKYPDIKLILAHVGRAYADTDMGNAFDELPQSLNLFFDLSANVNAHVFKALIKAVGPGQIMFGTDFPVLRMRGARIVENGIYYNLIPKGLYGDVSQETHMRELEGAAADKLTFMVYEQIAAFRLAAEQARLSDADVEDIFFNNAASVFGLNTNGGLE